MVANMFCLVTIFFFALLVKFTSCMVVGKFAKTAPRVFTFTEGKDVKGRLFGAVCLMFVSLLFSVPLKIATKVCLTVCTGGKFLAGFLEVYVRALSSLPSVIIKLFKCLMFLIFFKLKGDLLTKTLSISVLTVPIVAAAARSTVGNLPKRCLRTDLNLKTAE